MTLTNFDFRATHFEIKAPTKIHNDPNFESLTKLHDEIKRCAQNVLSNNGGGNYRHLGLDVTATDYQLVSITPFIRPVIQATLPSQLTPQEEITQPMR